MTWKKVFLGAMVIVAVAYYFHAPLPEAITDQWTLKLIIAGFRMSHQLASWGEKLGLDSNLNISRWAFSSAFKMTSYPVSDEGLVELLRLVEYGIRKASWILTTKQNLLKENSLATRFCWDFPYANYGFIVSRRQFMITSMVISSVPTRMYRPDDVTSGESLPVIIYFHGGGTILFSVDTYENVLRHISKDVRAVVIAVDYRLAPEHPYPAPLDDCVKVTRHVMKHASEYFGDVGRVALAGDSAGGLFTAAVALRLALETPDSQQPKLQVLLYPMLQAFDFQLPSIIVMNDVTHEIISAAPLVGAWYLYCTGMPPTKIGSILANKHISNDLKKSKFADYVSLDLMDDKYKLMKHQKPRSMQFDSELAKEFESCVTDPFFSPLMAADFSVFPTSYVMTSEYDVLRDEGIMFVSRLKEAGVKFFHNHVSNGWHGMVSYTRTERGQKALNDVIDFLTEHL